MPERSKPIIEVTSLDALAGHGITRVVIAAGVFDGVHLGHQLLLREMFQLSRQKNAAPVAFTFFPHPRSVLYPEKAPALLYPQYKKLALLASYGVEAVVTVPFTRQFAALSPDDFIKDTLFSSRVELCGICVGSNWHFGAKGKGSAHNLEEFAQKGHFAFQSVDELHMNGLPVSSTSIRRALAAGRLQEAATMLGRRYSLSGLVKSGHHIAGSRLSCPTANLAPHDGVLPPCGVYAARALLRGEFFPAAVNIGLSPTFEYNDVKTPRVEVHLLDFNGDLYGCQLEIEFMSYLREERSFPSPETLKKQIELDIASIRNIFQNNQPLHKG